MVADTGAGVADGARVGTGTGAGAVGTDGSSDQGTCTKRFGDPLTSLILFETAAAFKADSTSSAELKL